MSLPSFPFVPQSRSGFFLSGVSIAIFRKQTLSELFDIHPKFKHQGCLSSCSRLIEPMHILSDPRLELNNANEHNQ